MTSPQLSGGLHMAWLTPDLDGPTGVHTGQACPCQVGPALVLPACHER